MIETSYKKREDKKKKQSSTIKLRDVLDCPHP